MARGSSAPTKLRRLFFVFLFVTLFLNAGSLLALIRTQSITLALDRGLQPVLNRTGEFVSVTLEARLDLYRFLADYTGAEQFSATVGRMQDAMRELKDLRENATEAVDAREFDELADGVWRLGKLYELLIATRASERISEQNQLERQVEETSLQVLSHAQAMRERLKIEVARESERLHGMLRTGRFVFLASLMASLLITGGMYLVWKKFEASILGI